ncbi:MAG: NAD(+)/NADH kinase [Methanosphaera sp.]|nr:NAD(+)/NADH kinase [Methanosphaera sp.]
MRIYINTDKNKELAIKTKKELIKACNELKITVTDNPQYADLICSIGGDGTFLSSSQLSKGCPIIGINCGTLGYLTDVNPQEIRKALSDIKEGNYYIEERMMLEGEITKANGEKISIPSALNEISISKNTLGVIKFDTIINGKQINSYTADGIIICTPTGSTAYNLSCGGPIVEPTAQIITLTPIAPHTIINRSIILSDNSTIKIRINEIRNKKSAYVLYDGKPIEIRTGDTVCIRKSKQVTKIIKLNWQSFIETIRNTIK